MADEVFYGSFLLVAAILLFGALVKRREQTVSNPHSSNENSTSILEEHEELERELLKHDETDPASPFYTERND